jgi:hypothetical protein
MCSKVDVFRWMALWSKHMIVSGQILKKKVARADRTHMIEGDEARDGLTSGKRKRRRIGTKVRANNAAGIKRDEEGRELQDNCTGGEIAGSDDVSADDAVLAPGSKTCDVFKACNSARVVSVGMRRFASKKASHHV